MSLVNLKSSYTPSKTIVKNIAKTEKNQQYIPPSSLGEGLKRIKDAMGCVECLAKNIQNKNRLYSTNDGSTVYMTHAELHKTKKMFSKAAPYTSNDCDTFAGTAIRIKRSDPCGKHNTTPGQLKQLMKIKFFSAPVNDKETGFTAKAIRSITNFGIYNSEKGEPVVKYGRVKNPHKDGFSYKVQELEYPQYLMEKEKNFPTKNTEFSMPDGNIVYCLKDTLENGKRNVYMKMYEAGLDIPIL